MAVLTVEISEKLLAKLRGTGRPIRDVITETLEQRFNGVNGVNGENGEKEQDLIEPSREEVIQQLVDAGLIRKPGSWDTPGAKAWRERPEAEKQRLIKEMQATYFPDSFASNLISENRR